MSLSMMCNCGGTRVQTRDFDLSDSANIRLVTIRVRPKRVPKHV